MQQLDPPIYHLDIKPANCMFVDNSPHSKLKLLDFGNARAMAVGEFSRTHTNATGVAVPADHGTHGYIDIAISGENRANSASDVYSLGSVLYFCATGGKHPSFADCGSESEQVARFRSGAMPPIPPEVDNQLGRVITSCWSVDTKQRPAPAQLIGTLQRFVGKQSD
jgi:serine/threonine protein kinase